MDNSLLELKPRPKKWSLWLSWNDRFASFYGIELAKFKDNIYTLLIPYIK